jgi:ClpP class serine protease
MEINSNDNKRFKEYQLKRNKQIINYTNKITEEVEYDLLYQKIPAHYNFFISNLKMYKETKLEENKKIETELEDLKEN